MSFLKNVALVLLLTAITTTFCPPKKRRAGAAPEEEKTVSSQAGGGDVTPVITGGAGAGSTDVDPITEFYVELFTHPDKYTTPSIAGLIFTIVRSFTNQRGICVKEVHVSGDGTGSSVDTLAYFPLCLMKETGTTTLSPQRTFAIDATGKCYAVGPNPNTKTTDFGADAAKAGAEEETNTTRWINIQPGNMARAAWEARLLSRKSDDPQKAEEVWEKSITTITGGKH